MLYLGITIRRCEYHPRADATSDASSPHHPSRSTEYEQYRMASGAWKVQILSPSFSISLFLSRMQNCAKFALHHRSQRAHPRLSAHFTVLLFLIHILCMTVMVYV
jgi:hypothetical protein